MTPRDTRYPSYTPGGPSPNLAPSRRADSPSSSSPDSDPALFPSMNNAYSLGKTHLDSTDHTVAYTVSDDKVPKPVGDAVKTVADGGVHYVDGEVLTEEGEGEEGSPKGQAEGKDREMDGQGGRVVVKGEGIQRRH